MYHMNDVRWMCVCGWVGGGSVWLYTNTWEWVSYRWRGVLLRVSRVFPSKTECSMMKCSAFYECRPLHPTCTSCPPDVIHVVSVPRFPPSFTTPCFHVLYWMHTKEQKQGRPGNETRLIVNCYTIAICIVQPYILYCTLNQQAASVTDMQAKLNKALHYRCPKFP